MDGRTLLDFLALAEKMKCHTRHSWTSSGRKESVAEHTYRMMVFAWLVKDEFPEYDMDRVMKLCLFHDLGEAVTGDIPAFEKTASDEDREERTLVMIAEKLPEPYREELKEIFREVVEKRTKESKLTQALDKLEAVIQHNEAPIETWLPLEYDLQFTYGSEQVKGIPYMQMLKEMVNRDTRDKIAGEKARIEAEMRDKKFGYNIVLIGFMGTGKSTVSEYLSTMYNMETVEMDQVIAEREGMSISEIFSAHGEEYFRNLETSLLAELQSRKDLIISCGGGAALRKCNVAEMKKNGKVVLLTARPETVYDRVKESSDRPNLHGRKTVEGIAQLMEQRRAKYEAAADVVVQTDGKTVPQICKELVNKIKEMEEE